ncbi:MAG: isovaleryl-CoA dehydrogenase [Pseudomonadota bacterium]
MAAGRAENETADSRDGLPDVRAVFNQPAALADTDSFAGDQGLRAALALWAPALDTAPLHTLGRLAGSAAMQAHARLAQVHGPVLHTHDRQGRRIDEVEFHPSYHLLMQAAVGAGLHGTPWAGGSHAHLARAAGFVLFTGLEPAVLCPVSMSYAVAPALRGNPAVQAEWGPRLASRAYDPRLVPVAGKAGVTMGMGMTEKQGGSDVRANTSRALHEGSDAWGERYRLTGHKWFFSAPMSDAFLVLAQASGGLSCFFLPRVLPDGSRNGLRLQRLKDKLGNRANASAEVEFEAAAAWLVGEEGRGIPQILEMGSMTRLDCALGSAGLMRQALALALHHCAGRSAFGRPLVDQPLMRNVLADLALESEAATALALRLAHAFDHPGDPHERAMARLLTPVAKFWICKRGAAFGQEAMECLGGNGYVEEGGEGVMARIYREMPLNSIWEGAGNIMALDLLRVLGKGPGHGGSPGALDALQQELAAARGSHPVLDRHIEALPELLRQAAAESDARRAAETIALVVQAALLVRSAPAAVADAFCASRLAQAGGRSFGTLPSGTGFGAIIARAMPY